MTQSSLVGCGGTSICVNRANMDPPATPGNQLDPVVASQQIPLATSVAAPLEQVDTNFLNEAVQSAMKLEPQTLSSEPEGIISTSEPDLVSNSQTNSTVAFGRQKEVEKTPTAMPMQLTVEDGIKREHSLQVTTSSGPPQLAPPICTTASVPKVVPAHSQILNSVNASLTAPPPVSTVALQATTPRTSTVPAVPRSTSKQLPLESLGGNTSASGQSIPSALGSIQTGETTTLSSLLESLQQSDITLADLLNLNIPQLSHLQEGLRALLQNALLLQTLKSGAANIQVPSLLGQDKTSLTSSGTGASQSRRAPVTARIITKEKVQAQPVTPSSVPGLAHCSVTPSQHPAQSALGKPIAVTPLQVPKSQSQVTVGNVRMSLLSKMQQTASPPPTVSTSTLQSLSNSLLSTPVGLKTRPATRAMSKLSATSFPLVNPRALSPFMSTTVVQPVDQEPMDIDVGLSSNRMELPSHLSDHNYCIYNPVVTVTRQPPLDAVLNIPSERLSYAPEVPDSPRTLYKLLKVVPRKGSTSGAPRVRSQSRGSTPSSSTPRPRPTRYLFSLLYIHIYMHLGTAV